MKKLLLFLISLLTLQACTIQGLTSDYSKLDDSHTAMITDLKDFNDSEPAKIYKINGTELNTELQKYPKALVYVFTNGCTSDFCKPLIVYDKYAKKHDMKLFLVMSGYSNLDETLNMPHPEPLYSIDNEYYGTRFRNTYTHYFENELIGKARKTKRGEYKGGLFFFNNGKLEKTLIELPKD